jgi:hypothetical protein
MDKVFYSAMADADTVCMECGREFKYGDPYKERLVSMLEYDYPIVEVICVYCH